MDSFKGFADTISHIQKKLSKNIVEDKENYKGIDVAHSIPMLEQISGNLSQIISRTQGPI